MVIPKSLRIEGRATPIIETSSASRKSAPQSTMSAAQARLLRRSTPLIKTGACCADTRVDISFPFRR